MLFLLELVAVFTKHVINETNSLKMETVLK